MSYNEGTMQLKKDFKFCKKDFKTPWNLSCFDFFEKGDLLVGFDTITKDFCAFNLKKKRRSIIKGNVN
jgi:hypothetical protein